MSMKFPRNPVCLLLASVLLVLSTGPGAAATPASPPPPKPAVSGEESIPEVSPAPDNDAAPAEEPAASPVSAAPNGRKDQVVIGTGPVTGLYFPAGGAIQRVLNRQEEKTGFHVWTESADGSAANLKALKEGRLDMAIIQSDWQYHAVRGTGVFRASDAFPDLRSVLTLHAEPLAILVRVGTGIDSLAALEGKTVSPGQKGSPTRALMDMLFAARGWSAGEDLKVVDMAMADQTEALCSGEVDAIAFVAAHPNGLVQETAGRCAVSILPVEDVTANSLTGDNPFLVRTRIPGGLYPGVDDDVPTVGLAATLVTTASADEAMVHAVACGILDRVQDFRDQHPVLHSLTAKTMAGKPAGADLHPGAERCFREEGLLRK
ncbi:MAG: TAXI family TRAP transporter solute-binding subunit [Pseudomonadota bacterium]|nr:TAXI family TRAP transporter solute-binding subunit [Pseudomonadota bacterium]